MRKFLLSGLAFGALALPAMAADMAPAPLPVYKAPVPVEICNWCGWYIGANAGYAWSNSDSVDTATTNLSAIPALNGNVGGAIATQGTGSVSTKNNGFIGGGQLGYNWQA